MELHAEPPPATRTSEPAIDYSLVRNSGPPDNLFPSEEESESEEPVSEEGEEDSKLPPASQDEREVDTEASTRKTKTKLPRKKPVGSEPAATTKSTNDTLTEAKMEELFADVDKKDYWSDTKVRQNCMHGLMLPITLSYIISELLTGKTNHC